MAYRVERSEDVDRDLEAIFDFLVETALDFGESAAGAIRLAARRIDRIEEAMEALGRAPHQGTLHPSFEDGLRHVTKDRAILYFDLDAGNEVVRITAVFHGGQDHQRRMLLRLLGRSDAS